MQALIVVLAILALLAILGAAVSPPKIGLWVAVLLIDIIELIRAFGTF